MEQFIFKHTWFLLYIFRFLGIYPLQRDGEVNLKLTSACTYWFRYICTIIVVTTIQVLGQICLLSVEKINTFDLF